MTLKRFSEHVKRCVNIVETKVILANMCLTFQEFACNGTVIEHKEYGEVLQLQGDQRLKIRDWLKNTGLVSLDQLKVHGF